MINPLIEKDKQDENQKTRVYETSANMNSISNSVAISILCILIVVGIGVAAVIIFGGNNGGGSTTLSSTSTSSTSIQKMDGVITGYVTIGSSTTSGSLVGYSLEFSLACPSGSSACEVLNYSASISPSGHYSVLLPAGTYSIVGLEPTCPITSCSSISPDTVVVEGGVQLVVNVAIG